MFETLGHYKILDRIGAGGLGDVYRARDTRLGRTVAVKVPGAELQAAGDRREALLRDARIASVLSHPNIAALYELEDVRGYEAMTYRPLYDISTKAMPMLLRSWHSKCTPPVRYTMSGVPAGSVKRKRPRWFRGVVT